MPTRNESKRIVQFSSASQRALVPQGDRLLPRSDVSIRVVSVSELDARALNARGRLYGNHHPVTILV